MRKAQRGGRGFQAGRPGSLFMGLFRAVLPGHFPGAHEGHQNLRVSPATGSSLWLVEFRGTKEVGSAPPEPSGMAERWPKPQHA